MLENSDDEEGCVPVPPLPPPMRKPDPAKFGPRCKFKTQASDNFVLDMKAPLKRPYFKRRAPHHKKMTVAMVRHLADDCR